MSQMAEDTWRIAGAQAVFYSSPTSMPSDAFAELQAVAETF